MNRYYNTNYSDHSASSWFLWVVMLIVLVFVINGCNNMNIESNRAKSDMVYIKDGYCYDRYTKIIYKEIIVDGGKYFDSPTYTPYINQNGNYCKYENGEWVEFVDN